MGKVVLGVFGGAGAIAAVTVGGTYLSTGETWESSVLRAGKFVKYGDNEDWTFNALKVHDDWKDFFECCCKTGASGCSGADSDGECKPSDSKIWKVRQDKKEAINKKCSELGRRVDWAWNRNKDDGGYTDYAQFCFKQKSSS